MSIDPLTPHSRARFGKTRKVYYDEARYFIYTLLDANGEAVYVGRSCNVAARIKAHHGNIGHPFYVRTKREPLWLLEVRSLTLLGPFTWDEACRVERREIERHQPRGNRMYTKAHGYRPLAEGGGRYIGAPAP